MLSAQQLLEKIDQQRIWFNLIGFDKVGVKFKSPLRTDDHRPDCKLGIKGSKIRFYDPARGLNLDIFDVYKIQYPADRWPETVERILGWNGGGASTVDRINAGTLWQPKYTLTPKVVEWSDWGLGYWAKRGVSQARLSNPASLVQEINGYDMVGENELGHTATSQFGKGFVYWCNGKCKLYFPEAPKDKKFKGKFQPNDVWLLDRSARREKLGEPDNKLIIFGKGNKDLLVWSTIVNCDLANVNGEGVFPTPEWLMTNIRIKYEKVIICFDPDEAGVKGSNNLKTLLESLSDIGVFVVKVWNWPDPVSKDLDQYRVDNGYEQAKKYLMQNNFHKIFQ